MKKLGTFLRKHRISLIFAVLTISVMCIIFCFSAQSGGESSAVSSGVSRFIAELIVSGFDELSDIEREAKIEELVPIIRKLAHFSVFCALGFFANLSLHSFYKECGKNTRFVTSVWSGAFCLFYAMTDEFHQLFINGRNGNFIDVLIDFSGSLVGISVAFLLFVLVIRICNKKNEKVRG